MSSFILAATVVEMPVTTGFLKVTVHLSSGALVEMTTLPIVGAGPTVAVGGASVTKIVEGVSAGPEQPAAVRVASRATHAMTPN